MEILRFRIVSKKNVKFYVIIRMLICHLFIYFINIVINHNFHDLYKFGLFALNTVLNFLWLALGTVLTIGNLIESP